MPVPTPTVADLATMALLNPMQREMITREAESLDRVLHGKGSMHGGVTEGMSLFEAGSKEVNPHIVEPTILRDMHTRNMKTLHDGSAADYSPQQKNQLWQLAKQLREKIRRGMPSYEQLERPTQENMDVFRIHQDRTIQAQLALRNIHRILDHHDETVVLETLRPTMPSHVDWEEYYGNFDKIFFSESQELAYQIQTLDDDTYLGFLRLKAQGVTTAKLIIRELNLSQACYEACMHRLAEELGARKLLDEQDALQSDTQVVEGEGPGVEQVTKSLGMSKAERDADRMHKQVEKDKTTLLQAGMR